MAIWVILLVLVAVLVALAAAGLAATRRRVDPRGGEYARHVSEADRALERARAEDTGWDRDVLEEIARRALAEQRRGSSYERFEVVVVDDQPGVVEDRAELLASGPEGNARVLLARGDSGWVVERIE